MPVFFEGKPLFWTVSRAHHADVGAPIPSTYLPYAKTIYEEGLHFPGVRVERGYKEIRDIIRMARMKVRVPDLWYGDYLAQVGACRTAERRIKELVEKYGQETIAAFVEAWMAYGERRAAAAIRTLPAGTWSYENRHDPLPGVADEGIPVRARVTVDPDEAMITVDVRDNIDCIAGGLNLSETCSIAACRAGVFYNIDHTIPHNEGSCAPHPGAGWRDNCIVGRPRYPVGTSVATTNVTDRLGERCPSCLCFAQIGPTHGMAEGGYQQAAWAGGHFGRGPAPGWPDLRQPDVHRLRRRGPGLPGYDGWVTFGGPVDGGMQILSPTEVDESMFPIHFEVPRARHRHAGPRRMGRRAGHARRLRAHRGRDDRRLLQRRRHLSVQGRARGKRRRALGQPEAHRRRHARHPPPLSMRSAARPGEMFRFVTTAGGGYGDPTRRDPAAVARAVGNGWLSPEKAEAVYAVALRLADDGIRHEGGRGRNGAAAERRSRAARWPLLTRPGTSGSASISAAPLPIVSSRRTRAEREGLDADQRLRIFKTPSTPAAFEQGFMNALALAAEGYGLALPDFMARGGAHRPRHDGLDQRAAGGQARARRADLHPRLSRHPDAAGSAPEAQWHFVSRRFSSADLCLGFQRADSRPLSQLWETRTNPG